MTEMLPFPFSGMVGAEDSIGKWYQAAATIPIFGSGWLLGNLALTGETGLQSFQCQGTTEVGLKFKDECDSAHAFPLPRPYL